MQCVLPYFKEVRNIFEFWFKFWIQFCVCLGRAYIVPALNLGESGCSRPKWLSVLPPTNLCCFDDTALSPWSVYSPNGATFSCFWASSWWSWPCCPEKDIRRGSPTSSASSASQRAPVCQAATTQQLPSLEWMYIPTSPTYPKVRAMGMICPTARRSPLW